MSMALISHAVKFVILLFALIDQLIGILWHKTLNIYIFEINTST